ncbi:hypothetical protein VTN02DRAFT_4698 [Thermoascus thermophilus]
MRSFNTVSESGTLGHPSGRAWGQARRPDAKAPEAPVPVLTQHAVIPGTTRHNALPALAAGAVLPDGQLLRPSTSLPDYCIIYRARSFGSVSRRLGAPAISNILPDELHPVHVAVDGRTSRATTPDSGTTLSIPAGTRAPDGHIPRPSFVRLFGPKPYRTAAAMPDRDVGVPPKALIVHRCSSSHPLENVPAVESGDQRVLFLVRVESLLFAPLASRTHSRPTIVFLRRWSMPEEITQ